MMKHWLVIAFVIIVPSVALGNPVDTAENNPVFYERESGATVRFFYDDHYYLVDKNCELKAIELVRPYDVQPLWFIGECVDFDNDGMLILEGNYVDGKKHDDFKAYHPNAQLKWQASYVQGIPEGSLNF